MPGVGVLSDQVRTSPKGAEAGVGGPHVGREQAGTMLVGGGGWQLVSLNSFGEESRVTSDRRLARLASWLLVTWGHPSSKNRQDRMTDRQTDATENITILHSIVGANNNARYVAATTRLFAS